MNRINEIGDTPRGQKALGAVFARAHNRKNWCDKNMVEPHRKDAKDYWQNVEHNASSEVGRNAKDKLKGFENFGAGAQEYYKNHLPNDTIQIPQHESKNGNMNKKLIRLTEQDLHRIVKESVNKIINEIGDTQRGQWMLGRLKNRQSNGGGKFARGINYNDAGDYAYKANGNSYSDDYQQGYEDEGNNGRNADSTWDGNKYRRMQFNYDAKKMSDMDKLGRKFIDFIEHYQGGVLLQTIVDYETGNQTGKPESPLKELIPIFEEEVLGYDWGTKCTPEMRKAIEAAYNQWWNYAEPMLTDNY